MAEPYGTPEECDEYMTDRGYLDWFDIATSPEDLQLAARVRGSDYIDRTYAARFPGTKTDGREQLRQWPRSDAVDCEGNEIPDDEVPLEVRQASYEAALREARNPGSLTPDFVAADKVIREKVGDLEVQYSDRGPVDASSVTPVVSVIDGILSCLISDAGIGGTKVTTFLRY